MVQHSVSEASEDVSAWIPWRAWVSEHALNIFPSHASFEWFIRRHRDALVASGQYIPRKGRGGAVVGPDIDRVVLDIMRREAVR